MKRRYIAIYFFMLSVFCFGEAQDEPFQGTNVKMHIPAFMQRNAFTNVYISQDHLCTLWYIFENLDIESTIVKYRKEYLSSKLVVIDNDFKIPPEKHGVWFHSSLTPRKKVLLFFVGDRNKTTMFYCEILTGILEDGRSNQMILSIMDELNRCEITQEKNDLSKVVFFSFDYLPRFELVKSVGNDFYFRINDNNNTILSFVGYYDNSKMSNSDGLLAGLSDNSKIISLVQMPISMVGSDSWRLVSRDDTNGIIGVKYRVKNKNKVLEIATTLPASVAQEEIDTLLGMLDTVDFLPKVVDMSSKDYGIMVDHDFVMLGDTLEKHRIIRGRKARSTF